MSKGNQVLVKFAQVLNKLSGRITEVARNNRINTDAIAVLRDEHRLKIGKLIEDFEDLTAAHVETKKENDRREECQTLRDQSNVQSLVNLRDSTAKAFDQVKLDVESLMKSIQRLNERIGQAESKITWPAPSTIDQGIVNSKLAGVYNVTADLEKRIAAVEAETALFNRLRRAQSELNSAQEAFLFGPPAPEGDIVVSPECSWTKKA